MKTFSIAVSMAFVLALAMSAAHAQEAVTLRFALPGSTPDAPNWKGQFEPWLKKVEADSQGSLKLQPFFGATIANFGNVYDRLVGGTVDIAYGLQAAIGGKFTGSSVVELPSNAKGAEGAAAFWKLYDKGLIAKEYSAFHLLALYVYPQSFLSGQKPIRTLADIKGLRVASLTKLNSNVLSKLGAAPLSANPPDLYELLQRRTADGLVIGWLGLVEYKLTEVTTNHLALGLGSGGGMLMINSDAYAKLPPKAKEALDKNSGYEASRVLGADLDNIYGQSEAKVRALSGHTITTLDPAEKALFDKDVAQPVIQDWANTIPNGPAILAAYQDELHHSAH